jgi:hypothetical protein
MLDGLADGVAHYNVCTTRRAEAFSMGKAHVKTDPRACCSGCGERHRSLAVLVQATAKGVAGLLSTKRDHIV